MNCLKQPTSTTVVPAHPRRLLGQRTGIVREILHYLPDRTDPTVYYATALESKIGALTHGDVAPLEAGGTGLTRRKSLLRTLGEAAERYCLYFPDKPSLRRGTYTEISTDQSVVSPEYFTVYERSKYAEIGLKPLSSNQCIWWQPATNLCTGETIFVPAQWVWMGLDEADGFRYHPTTSNGCACGPSIETALFGALTEAVERDAIMRSWFTQQLPQTIALPAEASLQSIVSRRFATHHLEVGWTEFDSAIDLPVIGCAVIDRRHRAPKVALAGASGIDRQATYRAALIEAAQTWIYLKELVASGEDTAINPTNILNLEDNLRWYADPGNFNDVAEFVEGQGPPEPPRLLDWTEASVRDQLTAYLKRIEAADLTPLCIELTTPDIRSIGFRVVRVVIPELVDLTLPSLPPVGHPALAGMDLTNKPHPYP